MKPKDIEFFEEELNRMVGQLSSRAGERSHTHENVGADGVPDFADYAADKAEIEVSDRIADSEVNLLKKIELALSRLADGTFDKCASCGGKIPIARLRAKPTVSLCVPCQEQKEAVSP
jgi:DnaK suppressor protein